MISYWLLLDDIDDSAVGGVVVIDSSYNMSNNFWMVREHFHTIFYKNLDINSNTYTGLNLEY